MLAQHSIVVVLVANPDGRKLVENGEFCQRTPPNSEVDMNRDWSSHWNPEASAPDQKPGVRAFSRPETRLVRDSLLKEKANNVVFFLSVHSGKLGLYAPWAFDMNKEGEEDVISIASEVGKMYCQCPVGPAGKMLAQNAYGTCLDWVR